MSTIILVSLYAILGIILNMLSWDKKDDKIFGSDFRIQTVYILGTFLFWPIFFAMRTGRFLRKRFTEDVSQDRM